MEEIIARGAEAVILRKGELILKRRIKKSYRLNIIDEGLRKNRTRREAKLLEKASKIIFVPKLLKADEKNKEIEMEFIKGKKLSEHLDSMPDREKICRRIGEFIAKLHDAGIIHGDLTTSNIILADKDKEIYFIDFGLGFNSNRIEDKAVDLHLIKEALEAKHFNFYKECFNEILEGYKISKNAEFVFKRLEKVEKRGRYKASY